MNYAKQLAPKPSFRQRPFVARQHRAGLIGLLCFSFIAVLLSACGGHGGARVQLQRAEALMESDAKAASAALDSITPTTLRGEARARYALLRTQTDYKNYVPLTSDSLILIATRHYGTRRQTLPAALAQYYLGCTYKEMGRDLDAIDALLRATTLFPDDTNRYLPYTYAELGNLYLSHNMPDEAIQVLRRYKEYGIAHNDEEVIGQADYFIGRGYLYSQLNDSAYESFHRVISNHASSKQYIDASHFQLSKLCLYQYHDSLRATQYINQYINANADSEDMGAAYLIKAELSSGLSEVDSALCYYQLAISKRSNLNARCWAYKGLSRLAPLVNKTDSVGYYSDMFANLLDSVYLVNHRSEINELITNHTIELHDREMAERHNRLLWTLGVCALCVVAGVTISVLAIKKRQQEKYTARINGLQDKVRQLSNELAQAKESRSDMAADDEPAGDISLSSVTVAEGDSLFLQLIDSSVKLYVERNRRMHETLMNYNPSLGMDMETRRQFISTLDLSFAELTSTLLLYYPTLKREEVRTAVCSLLGYRPKLTSELFSVTLSGLRSRKQRLKSKLPEQIFALFYPQREENCPSGDSDNQ